jgi:hypothetical protein
VFEGHGCYSEEWCYLEFLWTEDQAMEEMLRLSSPFREVKSVELPRYQLKGRET